MAEEVKKPAVLRHETDYRGHRRRTYPETGDALAAIADFIRAAEKQGFELPQSTAAWLAGRDAVKTRFPKS